MQRVQNQLDRLKSSRTGLAISLCMILFTSVTSLMACAPDQTPEIALAEGSKLWLEGDSTLHAYEATATTLHLESKLTPDRSRKGVPIIPFLEGLNVIIPVKSLISPTKGLSSALHKTLKAKEHANIEFEMLDYDIEPNKEDPRLYLIKGHGNLTVGGKVNEIDIEMLAKEADGLIQVTGEKDLLMTDYDIDPPTFLFGKMTTADLVTIKWSLNVKIQHKNQSDKTEKECNE
jgi:hypothetical protein